MLIVLNLTPVPRTGWELQLQGKVYSKEIFSSDAVQFGGTGSYSNMRLERAIVNKEEKKYKLLLNLPPLAAIILR